MKQNSLIKGLCFLIQASVRCIAYTLANDCTEINTDTATKIHTAMTSFDNMAAYAIGRTQDPNPNNRQGTLLQDLLGANSENDPVVLALVGNWVQQAKDLATSTGTRQGQNVLIYCSDAHLNPINAATGYYRDRDHNNAHVTAPRTGPLAPGVTNACGQQVLAFTYILPGLSVIVLCSDWAGAALNNIGNVALQDVTLESHRGDDWRNIPNSPGINLISRFLSYVLFHEMMHATSYQQFPAQLPDRDANGAVVTELYGYQAITGNPLATFPFFNAPPTANNRQHNADSYALLACAWYMYPTSWHQGFPFQANPVPPATYAPVKARSVSSYVVHDGNATVRHVLGLKRRITLLAVVDFREPLYSAF